MGGIAGIYLVAFVSLAVQVLPLLGAHGLSPIADAVAIGSRLDGFVESPSLLWIPGFADDNALITLGLAGIALSVLALALVAIEIRHPRVRMAQGPVFFTLWLLYLSFVQLGDRWYGYGWETLLLEAGMLTTILALTRTELVLWLYRWLTFRLMFGAGLIKVRGDECWRDLTCLRYHFETQPIPNPLSWYLDHLPHAILDFGVGWNHFVELIVPWGLFHPRTRRWSAWIIVHFQAMLILSGNLAFLNWLTLAICLPIAFHTPRAHDPVPSPADISKVTSSVFIRRGMAIGYAGLVAALSVAPTVNLFSPGQRMNASFDRLHLVNTYGAFGTVGKTRDEIILEGYDGHDWKAWDFPFKPGDPMRRPPIIAPFQPRLDWQIWFAAMESPRQNLWLVHLLYQLLEGQASAKSLLANDPFPDAPPQRVRADLYRYRFTAPGEPGWWHRDRLGAYLPAFDLSDPGLQQLAQQEGW